MIKMKVCNLLHNQTTLKYWIQICVERIGTQLTVQVKRGQEACMPGQNCGERCSQYRISKTKRKYTFRMHEC